MPSQSSINSLHCVATNSNCDQWARTPPMYSNLNGPYLGSLTSPQTPAQLTDQRATDLRKRNTYHESDIEHENPSTTINPALLQRELTYPSSRSTELQVELDTWSSHSLPSTPCQTDDIPNRGDGRRSTPTEAYGLGLSHSPISRHRRPRQHSRTPDKGDSAGSKTPCIAVYRSIASPNALARLTQIISSTWETPVTRDLRCRPTDIVEVFHMLDQLELTTYRYLVATNASFPTFAIPRGNLDGRTKGTRNKPHKIESTWKGKINKRSLGHFDAEAVPPCWVTKSQRVCQ